MARMRAARLYGPGLPLRLEDVPIPSPAPGEALLRVSAAGICHTELHMLDGVLNLGVVPLTPGHEVVGEVVEAREEPAASGRPPAVGAALMPGQRVLLYYYAPCGDCAYCRAGQDNLCPNVARQFGFTADGGYAEYMTAPLRSLLPIPDNLSDEDAVGLACGGATALHAARTVAAVQPGETAVVYGIGGVGLYLVQLCRLAGATVLAVGRTPAKLALALELGAHTAIDARSDDPLSAVYDRTNGAGADVVFDLVASAETMAIAPRMLARRGRLVFAGYGGDRFAVSPLWLVLRELQVRGAVGNTLAELRETLTLAAGGRLRSVAGPAFPLEQINDALAALRAGAIIGRAMVRAGDPSLSSPFRSGRGEGRPEVDSDGRRVPLPSPFRSGDGVPRAVTATEISAVPTNGGWATEQQDSGGPNHSEAAPRPALAESPDLTFSATGQQAAAPTRTWVGRGPGETSESSSSPPPPPSPRNGEGREGSVPRPFARELLDVIAQGVDGPLASDDAAFNALALGLFRYQYAHNEPYRRFCDYRHRTPEQVAYWTDIPAVPIGAFKEAILATEPSERAVACFMSSGTTRPEQRSRHYHPDLAVYDASARTNFAAHLLPDEARLPLLVLDPPPAALPNSSLAHYLGLMLDAYGAPGSDYFMAEGDLRREKLLAVLQQAVDGSGPVCLAGTTFALVHLLDHMAAAGTRLALPPGSRVMDTGGVKGRSREISREELSAALVERLGIPADHQVNMYGLTELSTQFLDATLREATSPPAPPLGGEGRALRPDGGRRHLPEHPRFARVPGRGLGGRFKTVPAWARTRVLDPETLAEVPVGQVGVLCHTDLANRASVCTILTEDLGVARGGGFEILGRVAGSQARGCSIAMDELLTATRGRA